MIKIGIEIGHQKLKHDLLMHPERYFFILVMDGAAFLCIRTCDARGEDIISHVVDGLRGDPEGNLVSVFGDGLEDAIIGIRESNNISREDEAEYPLSAHLKYLISAMPGLIDWILSSVVKDGRNLVINSLLESEIPCN